MSIRRSIIVVENFYTDPDSVRDHALALEYYWPYPNWQYWQTSTYKPFHFCPFKSSSIIIKCLEDAVGEKIDMEHWKANYPVNDYSQPIKEHPDAKHACLWNGSFHAKFNSGVSPAEVVHNHVIDSWNPCGENGWAGIIYLNPTANLKAGLNLWMNTNPDRQLDWMTPSSNWLLVDSFANIYNRLILCRSNLPHSGSDGFGKNISTSRLFQTFFFRTRPSVYVGAVF